MNNMYLIKHDWLGYLTGMNIENTVFRCDDAKAFTFDEANEFLSSSERDVSRHFYLLIPIIRTN
jgi:hypothetical protein